MSPLAFLPAPRRAAVAKLGAAGLASLMMMSFAPAVAHSEVDEAASVKPGQVVAFGSEEAAVPAGLDDAVAIAASGSPNTYSSLAVRADGSVVGWGRNTWGEASVPRDLSDVADVDITAGLGLALTSTGSVVAWGDNRSGSLDVPADLGTVKDIAVGGNATADGPCNYALALKSDGTVVRWGQNNPELPCFDMSLDPPADLTDVVEIDANDRGGVALKSDGTVVGWGKWFDIRWDGTNVTSWSGITQVSLGGSTVLGLEADGSIAQYGVWGESGPGLKGPATSLSAGVPDLWLTPTGEIQAYRSAPTPAGTFQAVAAGWGYGLAIATPVEADPELPPAGPALGSDEIQSGLDSNPAGTAESFQYTANADLRARTFSIYLDKRSTARLVIVGVYADRHGEPGKLLASGRTRTLTAGAWNTIDISRVDIEAGKKYWLGVLTPLRRGTVWFRDLPDGQGGPTRTSAVTWLTAKSALPYKWRSGREYGNAPASMYLR